MKRTHRGLVLIGCLLMVLTAACGERQPNTLGSPATEKSEGLGTSQRHRAASATEGGKAGGYRLSGGVGGALRTV